MSGGYFEYRDRELDDFADDLQDDIDYNDLDYTVSSSYDGDDFIEEKHFGHHHSEETLAVMRGMVKDLRRLSKLLHEYDWYVSSDTCEETFLECARDIMDGKR
jgi:hypothetical protein